MCTAIWIVSAAVEDALTIKMPLLVMKGVTKTLCAVVTPVAVQVAIAVVEAVMEPMVTVQVPNWRSATVSPTLLTLILSSVASPVDDAVVKTRLPAKVSAPAEENVDVAVAPKYASLKTDSRVDDACPSDASPDTVRVDERVLAPVAPSVPATLRFPAELKVEVAVPPKYAVSTTENRVEEACPKVVKPVTLAVPSVEILLPMVVAASTIETINSTETRTAMTMETGPTLLRNRFFIIRNIPFREENH